MDVCESGSVRLCTELETCLVRRVQQYELGCRATSLGAAPDPSKWTYDVGNNWGIGEVDTGTNSRQNSYQDGSGHLVIQMLNPSSGVYTSAHLKTAGLYAAGPYGKIKASIQTAATDEVRSAFWSLGTSYVSGTPWPPTGEIDFLERLGRTPMCLV